MPTSITVLYNGLGDSLSRAEDNGRVLTGSATEWDAITGQGTYLVAKCSDIPGNAYNYGILRVFAVPSSIYGRIQVYVPDTATPKVFVRTQYGNTWRAWGCVKTEAV